MAAIDAPAVTSAPLDVTVTVIYAATVTAAPLDVTATVTWTATVVTAAVLDVTATVTSAATVVALSLGVTATVTCAATAVTAAPVAVPPAVNVGVLCCIPGCCLYLLYHCCYFAGPVTSPETDVITAVTAVGITIILPAANTTAAAGLVIATAAAALTRDVIFMLLYCYLFYDGTFLLLTFMTMLHLFTKKK